MFDMGVQGGDRISTVKKCSRTSAALEKSKGGEQMKKVEQALVWGAVR